MMALFRNPLVRWLFQVWWLFYLPTVMLRVAHMPLLGKIVLCSVAAITGMIGIAWAHGAYHAVRGRYQRNWLDYRFLCPRCLQFGGFHFVCGECRGQVESFIIHTNGAYVNDCPNCHARLLSRDGQQGVGVRAYCKQCGGTCRLDVHHQRQVRVLVALRPSDFASLCQAIGAQAQQAQRGISYACHDDGLQLTYVLNLSRLTDAPLPHAPISRQEEDIWVDPESFIDPTAPLPPMHALRAVEAIWLDSNSGDPQESALEVGQAADQFVVKAGLSEVERSEMMVCVRQATLPIEVQHVLESRFGMIKYGVSAASFISGEAQTVAAPTLRLASPPTVHTISEAASGVPPGVERTAVRE